PQRPTNPDGGTGGAPPILPEPDSGAPPAKSMPSEDASTSVGGGESSESGCAVATWNGGANRVTCFPGTSRGAFVVGVFWLAVSAGRFRRSRRDTSNKAEKTSRLWRNDGAGRGTAPDTRGK